jgi:hypothetical protein
VAGFVLLSILAFLGARYGTDRARLGAGLLLLGGALGAFAWWGAGRFGMREPSAVLRRLVWHVDRARAERALRALTFVREGARGDGTSDELARLHVSRVVAALPAAQVVERATKSASRLRRLALAGWVAALLVGGTRLWSVLEGADVLVARQGTAPVPMRWLDEVDLASRPPEYLHEGERSGLQWMSLLLPYGSTITVQGVPQHAGRRLFLTDGITEVPFVEDGAGAVVARWPLKDTTTLHVVARFGDVVIPQSDPLLLDSLPDLAPVVRLEGAPRTLRVADEQQGTVPLRYEATDDHGLREVHLVLRSGTREERRVLSRLDGEQTTDKGGYVLKLRDPFVRASHVPVEVTVEAKDNDPLTGPKWGASAAIVLVPPDVGEPEARRLDALRRVRDALVDALAWRIATPPPQDAKARAGFVDEEGKRAEFDEALATETLSQTYAGVRVPPRLRSMVLAQEQKTRKAVDAEARGAMPAGHAEVVRATERFVLVVDAMVRGMGMKDAREAAKLLADAADDLALGAAQRRAEGVGLGAGVGSGAGSRVGRGRLGLGSPATVRMDAATLVLGGGGQALLRLGALGRDLGEIVDADLSRVRRARDSEDWFHAELAARDLATRLHQPDPSFGPRGGRPGRARGESGGAQREAGDEAAPPDEVERAFEESARDLEQLAQDHAGQLAKMEHAIADATSQKELEDLKQEAHEHAEAIREAARDLPSVGFGSDSWTSKGAAARELAERMARALDDAQTEDAVQSGRSAIGSLDEAKKMLGEAGWYEDPAGKATGRVERTRRKLEAEEQWAEQAVAERHKRAAERARGELEQGGAEEGKLADRARDVARQAGERGSLPDHAISSIEEAERAARRASDALRAGDADKGLEAQREAQRGLEAASGDLQGDDDERDEGGEGRSGMRDGSGVGPGRDPLKLDPSVDRADEFRRRALRGGAATGPLKDAWRRYVEGLLR